MTVDGGSLSLTSSCNAGCSCMKRIVEERGEHDEEDMAHQSVSQPVSGNQ